MEEKKEGIITERIGVIKTVLKYLEEVFGSEVILHEIGMNAKQMTVTVKLK